MVSPFRVICDLPTQQRKHENNTINVDIHEKCGNHAESPCQWKGDLKLLHVLSMGHNTGMGLASGKCPDFGFDMSPPNHDINENLFLFED